jgi:GLPGLI family protein
MKHSLLWLYIALFVAGSCLNSCSETQEAKQISEGVIEFKAKAVNASASVSMMAPDKMIVKFRNGYSLAELEAGMGAMRIAFLSDPNKQTFTSMVSFLDKSAAEVNRQNLASRNHYFSDYTVTQTEEIKKIANYNCKKAILKFSDGSPDMEVWYTEEIKIADPNWSNAYYKVGGVLMDYSLKKFGLELHFTASAVKQAKIDSTVFAVPASYKMISPDELEQRMKGLF